MAISLRSFIQLLVGLAGMTSCHAAVIPTNTSASAIVNITVDIRVSDSGTPSFQGVPDFPVPKTITEEIHVENHTIVKRWGLALTSIVLTNATPYRWRRRYIHSYQVDEWHDLWPKVIKPGNATRAEISVSGFHSGDSAGEVEYHLEGTSKPMSFMVKYYKGGKHKFVIKFQDHLQTMNNTKGSELPLHHHHSPGGSAFVLAGVEGEFISNNPVVGWMQAQLPYIGDLPLREIVMPRSHHSGLWKINAWQGFGRSANTQTQYRSLSKQLWDGGVRVIDSRPALSFGEWLEGHGSTVMGMWHGVLGADYKTMIDMINGFNEQFPGELIVWDVHPTDAWNGDNWWAPLDAGNRENFFESMKRLKYRLPVPDDQDITQWPVKRFIGDGRPAVLVRFDESWRQYPKGSPGFPGGAEGFVTDRNFPANHHWSDTNSMKKLERDQIQTLRQERPSRQSKLYYADWLLTQEGAEPFFAFRSLMEMGISPHLALFDKLWGAATDATYPNWLAIDDVDGDDFKTLVMAMNQCLAARRCGPLGGKVRRWREHRRLEGGVEYWGALGHAPWNNSMLKAG